MGSYELLFYCEDEDDILLMGFFGLSPVTSHQYTEYTVLVACISMDAVHEALFKLSVPQIGLRPRIVETYHQLQ